MANNTSINKSKLFKRAWELYNTPSFNGHVIPAKFYKQRFANCLKLAWNEAHYEALPVATKIEQYKAQLIQLDYAPWGVATGDKRDAINARISHLNSLAA